MPPDDDHPDWTPLHRAADAGDADGVKALLARGAPVNAVDGFRRRRYAWRPSMC